MLSQIYLRNRRRLAGAAPAGRPARRIGRRHRHLHQLLGFLEGLWRDDRTPAQPPKLDTALGNSAAMARPASSGPTVWR